jgi:CrcB protein
VETLLKIVVLSIGGTFGVNSRYWLGVWMNRWTSPQFPWATVVINVSGSFAIGFLTVGLARWLPHPNVRLLLITGFLGGYTTFSTFEYDTLTLWERGERTLVAANVLGSVVIGLAAVWLGTGLAHVVLEPMRAPGLARVVHRRPAMGGDSNPIATEGAAPPTAKPGIPDGLGPSPRSKEENRHDDSS